MKTMLTKNDLIYGRISHKRSASSRKILLYNRKIVSKLMRSLKCWVRKVFDEFYYQKTFRARQGDPFK